MVLQIVLIVFLIFAITRVLLQLRQKNLSFTSFLFWGAIFIGAVIGVVNPNLTSDVALLLGIGRGADVVIYFSIVTLFYLIFRLTVSIEEIRNEITKFVRQIALENESKRKK